MATATSTPSTPLQILPSLTLPSKISLLSGSDFWTTHAVSSPPIPSLKTSDGPNGARGSEIRGAVTSACFPACVSLAATFDAVLAERIGRGLATETRSKSAHVLLGPTVCPARDPRGGRNFEAFSEDPVLAGVLAASYVRGLQDGGVGATVKHFVANEIDAGVGARALREVHLKPFEIVVKEARPWAVMTSYNKVNGVHADMHGLIEGVLRGKWGFGGCVMSDWGWTNSTAGSMNAGLDLEMPRPGAHRTQEKVRAALQSGEVEERTLDARVLKVLELVERAGLFEARLDAGERADDRPEHRALIRQAGADGMVLLKNDKGLLPLAPGARKSVAVLGLADEFLGHGGGSASVSSHHRVTAWEALQGRLGADVALHHAPGVDIQRSLEPLAAHVVDEAGAPGWTRRIFSPNSAEPETANVPGSAFQSLDRADLASVDLRATFTPQAAGSHYLSFATVGPAAVYVDDAVVFDSARDGVVDFMAFILGTAAEVRTTYRFEAGRAYALRISARVDSGAHSDLPTGGNPVLGIKLGFKAQAAVEADLLTPAVRAAADADAALVFVGHTPVWETEGADREGLALPTEGSQDELVARIAAVNRNTVVVVSTGSPVSMPWLDSVGAVLQAWFPGQEAGHAIADVLTGAVNPGGKLPVTFPRRIEDAPTWGNFPFSGPPEGLTVEYAEGVKVGYRGYADRPEGVLFPFGFGLSYSSTAVEGVALRVPGSPTREPLVVTATVRNTGPVACGETVQVYLGAREWRSPLLNGGGERVKMALVGFAKVRDLEPGAERAVEVEFLAREGGAWWDESRGVWALAEGGYVVYMGTSSADDDLQTREFEVGEEVTFGP